MTGPSKPEFRLREITLDDAAAIHAIYGDERATRYLSFPPRNLSDVEKIVDRMVTAATNTPRAEYVYVLEHQRSGKAIGLVRLGVNEERNEAQIGFALNPDYWHNGYAAAMVNQALDIAFDQIGVGSVWGARDPDNADSQKVLGNTGFLEKGETVGVMVIDADDVQHKRVSPVARIDRERWIATRAPRIGIGE